MYQHWRLPKRGKEHETRASGLTSDRAGNRIIAWEAFITDIKGHVRSQAIDDYSPSASPDSYDDLKKSLMSTFLSKTPTAAADRFCVVTSLIRWLTFPITLSGIPTKAFESLDVMMLLIS